ncbi:MAG: FAD-dependent oxidoreductase [Firmicutes bacterium]|nr:FAD-dependent oxidoreductase [Bacillota bacterium]
MKKIAFQQEIPLCGEYDVIVAGGGTAGALAAAAAQCSGARTLIIEQFGSLGGSAALGLVTPLMSSHIPNDRGHCRLSNEITRRMRALGGIENDDYQFDPVLLPFVLEDMTAGCSILYHSMIVGCSVENGRISHVIVSNKDGLSAYSAKYFIDATGDADLAQAAGVLCSAGNRKGINQPVTLRFEMAGIDFDAFHAQMRELGYYGTKYFAMNRPAAVGELLLQAERDGVLEHQDAVYFQAFGIPGRPDAMNFNCPELSTQAGVASAEFISRKQIEGKQAILRVRNFVQRYIRGFEHAYITSVAPFVGFRESRRIDAEYVMTIGDVLSYRKFDDAVASSCYSVDVHGEDDVTLGLTYDPNTPENERFWQVPFRVMIAKGAGNLLVTGRCAGFDFQAQSATRVQLVCRSMGEAAGIGAAYAAGLPGLPAFASLDLGEVMRLFREFESKDD